MRSMFTVEEVSEMLDMTKKQIESEMNGGDLGFTYDDGVKKITLYDLEKYMGGDQALKITREFLRKKSEQEQD